MAIANNVSVGRSVLNKVSNALLLQQEFMEQIQVVQEAFNEERADYDKQVSSLKTEIRSLEAKLRGAVQQSELDLYRQQRDDAINQRDDIQLEKNRVRLT